MYGMYVHIPFCTALCYYCDFNTYIVDRERMNDFIHNLQKEITLYARRLKHRMPAFRTLYIGGGTPTCLSRTQLTTLVTTLRDHFSFTSDAEVTCEANPGSSNEQKYETLRAAGVNRLSIGVQSFDDALLTRIGRTHTADEAAQSVRAARRAGFSNVNVDVMFGLPGQTIEQWEATVRHVSELVPEHVSAYSLIVESGTPFGEAYDEGRLVLPDDDDERTMYESVIQSLEKVGYEHYEVSNFCLPGFSSRHNTIYWRTEAYLGLGPGAHGFWDGRRYANVRLPEEYAAALRTGQLPVEHSRTIPEAELMDDTMIFGLRLLEGVCRTTFQSRFGVDVIDVYADQIKKLRRLELIEIDADRIRLSRRGLFFGNQVFGAFLRDGS